MIAASGWDAADAWSEAWLDWLLQRSIAAAAALAVVGLVVWIGRRRLSAHAPSHLLLVPVLVLVVPFERILPTRWPEPIPAVGAPRSRAEPAAVAETGVAPPARVESDAQGTPTERASEPAHRADRGPDLEADASPAIDGVAERAHDGAAGDAFAGPAAPLRTWLMVGWVACTLLGAFGLVRRQIHADRTLRRRGRRGSGELQALFDRLCSERGFDAPIVLRSVPGLASPLATGILRRAVCLPPDLESRLAPTQLRFVLLHELEHHARRDVFAEASLRLVRLAFWFHPVVWIVGAAHRRWREYACDEAALARAGSTRRAPLADALFSLLLLANDGPRPRTAFASFSPSTHVMKSRLDRILDRSRAPRRGITSAALTLTVVAGLGALTAARAQDPTRPPTADPAPNSARPTAADGPAPVQQPIRRADGDVARAIDGGIAWLLRHQQPDGSWDLGADPKPNRTERDHNEAHVTGLALRALLTGWKGPRHLEIVRAVERGDDYLQRIQGDNGMFGAGEPMAEAYGHAQVLRALCAIQRHIPDDQRLRAIERGVAYAETARNPYRGWRYQPRDGDNDSKHTALMLLALREAEALGVEIPERADECARLVLEDLTAEESGRTGFVGKGQPMSRFVGKIDDFPPEFSEEPTAMRLLVEFAFGESVADDEVLDRSADLLAATPPRWDPKAGTIDYAYWSFGAQAMARVGGERGAAWREALHEALLPHRVEERDTAHWPAIDAWSRPGMEAYATASCVLALVALP